MTMMVIYNKRYRLINYCDVHSIFPNLAGGQKDLVGSLVTHADGSRWLGSFVSVYLCVCLFFCTMSQKTMFFCTASKADAST